MKESAKGRFFENPGYARMDFKVLVKFFVVLRVPALGKILPDG